MRKFERTNGKINPCGTLKETEKKKDNNNKIRRYLLTSSLFLA